MRCVSGELLTIASLNTRGIPLTGSQLAERYAAIGAGFDAGDADVVCCQEVLTYWHLRLLVRRMRSFRRVSYRPPGERDQAAMWSERAGPIAHPPERAHPADQQPQVPVRQHLLATDHVSIPGVKPRADRGIPPSQL